ncbi:hypothetical protein ERJ75_001639800 [Trypanosoma vivax]|nr:hypothetical protein ERJ75_001639800 [Trypanosoma vivax]
MGSLVDKSSGTTQSCLAKDSGLADAYAGDHNVATHLAKVCSKVFGKGMAKRAAEKMAPKTSRKPLVRSRRKKATRIRKTARASRTKAAPTQATAPAMEEDAAQTQVKPAGRRQRRV